MRAWAKAALLTLVLASSGVILGEALHGVIEFVSGEDWGHIHETLWKVHNENE